MLRQIPPLEGMEAFLAAAQARSFRAAAAALALSPSAFSRRIQLLEHFTGTALFDRDAPGIPLTPAGEHYLVEIGPALESIRQATATLRGDAGERTLRIATSHSFAAEWLVPRLPALAKVHSVNIALVVSRDPAILRTGAVDLAIWGGPLADLPEDAEPIVECDAVPVSAPLLASGRAPPSAIADFAQHRLLGVKASAGLWSDYLTATGFTGPIPLVETFDTDQLQFETAVSGLGLALAGPVLSERFLADRRLVACQTTRLRTGQGYALHFRGTRARSRPVARDFVAWLRGEIGASLMRFNHWHAAGI